MSSVFRFFVSMTVTGTSVYVQLVINYAMKFPFNLSQISSNIMKYEKLALKLLSAFHNHRLNE